MQDLELPEILDIPSKLHPLFLDINNYRYFLCEGGRGSGKTQSIARVILYLCEHRRLRVVCGRETQASIDDSVYTVLCDLIRKYDLPWDVAKTQLIHKASGSEIKFRGFKEHGAEAIKGLEAVDILWIEEAQSISKASLNIIIPTIRKDTAKVLVSMNRFLRNDPVYEALAGRADCKLMTINYVDNPYCPQSLITEANELKSRNDKEYRHIWLGEPLDAGDDYLFSATKLDAMLTVMPDDKSKHYNKRVLSIDLSGAGGDLCVAKVLYMRTGLGWCDEHTVTWSNPNTDYSIGRCIALYNEFQPNEMIVDACGIGYPMFVAIRKVIPDCIGFNGAETEFCEQHTGNHRAQSYLDLKELIDSGRMRCEDTYTRKDLEGIRRNFARKGKVYLISKQDMRKDGLQSPDRGDALAMGAFAIKRYFGQEKDFAPAYDIMQNGREVYADTSEWRL